MINSKLLQLDDDENSSKLVVGDGWRVESEPPGPDPTCMSTEVGVVQVGIIQASGSLQLVQNVSHI